MSKAYYFQELPADLQHAIFQRVSAGVDQEDLWLDREMSGGDLDLIRWEVADDLINRSNPRRTIKQWLEFAETRD